MDKKIIIINGNYRSGTTFMQKKLDNINYFEVLMQPCFFIFQMYEEALRKKLNFKYLNDFPTGLFFNKKIFQTKPEDLKIKKNIIEVKLSFYLKINPKKKNFIFTKKEFYKILRYEVSRRNEKMISLKIFIEILVKTIIGYRKKFSYNKKVLYVGFKEGYLTSLLPILVNIGILNAHPEFIAVALVYGWHSCFGSLYGVCITTDRSLKSHGLYDS